MKKFMSFIFVLFTIIMIGSMSACSKTEKSASGFSFRYEINSAQKISEQDQTYIVLALEVKNENEQINTISAEKFTLVQETKNIAEESVFGNNIIDKMTEESLDVGETISLVLRIRVDEKSSGKYSLCYEDVYLFDIKI